MPIFSKKRRILSDDFVYEWSSKSKTVIKMHKAVIGKAKFIAKMSRAENLQERKHTKLLNEMRQFLEKLTVLSKQRELLSVSEQKVLSLSFKSFYEGAKDQLNREVLFTNVDDFESKSNERRHKLNTTTAALRMLSELLIRRKIVRPEFTDSWRQ